VPLYAYEIPYIKRDSAPREFYEAATRELRFATYRAVTTELAAAHTLKDPDTPPLPAKVILGHIKDDVVENVWTNFAKAQHLDNLAKMELQEEQFGVTLLRPLLAVSKDIIIATSTLLGIPYLKNTTPTWSNRGKFRENFYEATHEQYGPTTDDAILQAAQTIKAQASLIEKLLYAPMYASWDPATRSLNIALAQLASLDAVGWLKIFENVCHKFLNISRPSIHAVREFLRRLASPISPLKVNMKKDLQVIVDGYMITFNVL
jgi:tRNA(Ile)-lysidine synthase TilS/MesJ